MATRYNQGKPDLSYLFDFAHSLECLVRVCEQGAIKYERGNWKQGGKPDSEYLGSALRHLMAFANNSEVYDQDIGTVHVANAVWNLLALIELNYNVPSLDIDFDQEAFKAKYADKSSFVAN